MPDLLISKLFIPVTGISDAYDKSDAVAPGSVYELFVGTTVLLLPTSTMVGAVLSTTRLEPVRFASVNVLDAVRSSLRTPMLNSRLSVSAVFELKIMLNVAEVPPEMVVWGTELPDPMTRPEKESMVPFVTMCTIIRSPVFAYMLLFALSLVIVNVSSPSGFACTVTVLFIESGMLPAASAGAEYVMFCGPSDDVSKLSGKAVTVCGER